ncbi:hypothetical protein ACQEVI_19750 [Promicromonospora sp. CA-289599]|uniref:hypothetical protein n=1 Tax=Promicromonospora sp. CA-289599 TaxID=3240014 RepID=UPI003D93E245
MALDETTRAVNRRAVDALDEAAYRLREANADVGLALVPLEALSRYTNAHDPALEELRAVAARIRAAREDVSRRLAAETEGQ